MVDPSIKFSNFSTKHHTPTDHNTASHYGVLAAVEAATGVDAAERARPVLSMAEIKHMYRLSDEAAEEECLAAFGNMFGCEDEPEEEGAADEALPAYALEVQFPWSRMLLDGDKMVETRAYPLPFEVLQQPVLLVESPMGGLAVHGLHMVSVIGCCEL